MSSAFSVAPRMATIRAICSLTAASRKHLKSRTLNETGTISSKMLFGSGTNSYGTRSPRAGFPHPAAAAGSSGFDFLTDGPDSPTCAAVIGKSVSTIASCRAELMNFV